MKRVLVTGGLGFLGVHTVNRFLFEGWRVHIVDNCVSNCVPKSHWAGDDRVTVDVRDIVQVPLSSLRGFDLVVHLASPVGPVGVLKYGGRMGSMIMSDTMRIIHIAEKNHCPLVFVSTSEIYGHRDVKTRLAEDGDKVLRGDFTVRNEYAVAKLLAEIAVTNHAKISNGFRYQLIRPFNISGRHQLPDNGFVLPRFVDQAIAGEPLTVYGSGFQSRAFTWVGDIVDGVWRCAMAHDGLWNQEWNVGNEANEGTINELADAVIAVTGSNAGVVHVDPTELHGPLFSEAPEKIPDSSKIRSLLGWAPTKSVADVVSEVVADRRSRADRMAAEVP